MKFIFVLFIFLAPTFSFACEILSSDMNTVDSMGDALYALIAKEECPQNVIELKSIVISSGLHTKPAMVANRGIHNPKFGSFSIFEEVVGSLKGRNISSGEFFFGHFTGAPKGVVSLDQLSRPRKLLVELIAWDYRKKVFNFYELLGTLSGGGQWFYRGDSLDALADNKKLHRSGPFQDSQFGRRMRCSACHNSGGPIMKELKAPHNDWMTTGRPLKFKPNGVSKNVARILSMINDASQFAMSVAKGRSLLESSPVYQKGKRQRSLQEQLRPLFCTEEINLVSDTYPLSDGRTIITVPGASLVNFLWGPEDLELSKSTYQELLTGFGLRFPETNGVDADHGWLTPVKSDSDIISIQSLVASKLISGEFVADVLAVDFMNPTFSEKRCGLLRLIPEGRKGWETSFLQNLKSSESEAAEVLLIYLGDADKNRKFHKRTVQNYLNNIRKNGDEFNVVTELFKNLLEEREKAFEDEISQNPMGQILEPGFRVIFPAPSAEGG